MKMFENAKTAKLFMSMLEDMSIDEQQEFRLRVHRFYDRKITGVKQYDCFLVTMSDLHNIANALSKEMYGNLR